MDPQGCQAMPSLVRTILLVCLLFSLPAYAGDVGTPEEAKAMALHAADLLRQEGPEKAFAAFDAKVGAFHDRDLYVMVYDNTGKNVAHGANPALIGKDLIDLKDTDGKSVVREIIATTDQSWVDYKWPNPITKKIGLKATYVVRVGDYFVGVGAYR
jgi:signal transduction histidine kinase